MATAGPRVRAAVSLQSHEVYLDIRPEATQERVGRACSVSSHGSRKSSHTAMSDSACKFSPQPQGTGFVWPYGEQEVSWSYRVNS